MFQNKYGGHDAELVRIAKHLASGLVGTCGFTEHDADDLLQTLIVAGTLAMPRFNGSKATRATFIYNVLREKVVDLSRHALRGKRGTSREKLSLDELWPGSPFEDLLWGDVIGVEHTLSENATIRADRKDVDSLRIDLQDVLKDLPPELRELCRLHSQLRPDEARRAAGMAKSSHHRAICRIREFLTEHGFTPAGTDWAEMTDNTKGNL